MAATTSRGVAEIAEDVGYESEAAFNRAFKREFGWPPRVIGRSIDPNVVMHCQPGKN